MLKPKLIATLISTLMFTFFVIGSLHSQCSFDPTVTLSPLVTDDIYCPGDQVTLSTQTYDSYQWFDGSGTMWPGGNTQSIVVDASTWALIDFYVEATDGGCTEESPSVNWDAWAFLPPAISHPPGGTYCDTDIIEIMVAGPGPAFFQWFLDGVAIPGATGSTHTVVQSGNYIVEVAYPECPNYWLSSGLGPTYTLISSVAPTITFSGGVLMSSAASSYQWYLDGVAISGATQQTHTPLLPGSYTVETGEGFCTTESLEYEIFDYDVDADMDGYTSDVDCDDTDFDINPGATEIPNNDIDEDCDGIAQQTDVDGDGYNSDDDCDDNNADINPGMMEIPYNGIDDDCNPSTPDDDIDGDGYGVDDDCNDNDPNVNPGQQEIYFNGIDDDCDPSTIDTDFDGDGFGQEFDCDDGDPDVNPAADEVVYNGIDDDCDPMTPDDDLDGDGYVLAEDCDDTNSEINSGVGEIAGNGIDDDCNPNTTDGGGTSGACDQLSGEFFLTTTPSGFDAAYYECQSGNLGFLPSGSGSEMCSDHLTSDSIPVVWYQVSIDDEAQWMYINVTNCGDWDPVFALYEGTCPEDLSLVSSDQRPSCNSEWEDIHQINQAVDFDSQQVYWIAISAADTLAMDDDRSFEVCVLTTDFILICNADGSCNPVASFDVVNRSNDSTGDLGLPLEGPFCAGEEVRICGQMVFDISDITVEWLQGIVPFFGPGWDIGSFDPTTAEISGNGMTPQWFDEGVPTLQQPQPQLCTYVDGFGNLQLCNALCSPCKECEPGLTVDAPLPGGWFWITNGGSAGCLNDGLPSNGWGIGSTIVNLDYCFDLKIRQFENEDEWAKNQDLTIGFQTFTDGITGCWDDAEVECVIAEPQFRVFETYNYDLLIDSLTCPIIIDEDLDGYFVSEDCDDTDPNVNPGVDEIVYNGIDDDCNPATLDDDLDQDGFNLMEDCDDTDADVFVGASCDDADVCTIDDTYDSDCNCIGIFQDTDGDGICDALDEPEDCTVGESCDDNDVCTIDDIYDADCVCLGQFQDSDGDGICDALDDEDDCVVGEACDDGDDCTDQDVYTMDCVCIGQFQDSDDDGICDSDDETDGDCTLGESCDDGDACTVQDNYDADCNCVGVFQDSDEDGVCNAEDCKPFNANVYPGNTEIPYNGLDDDCDELTLDDDLDQDGFTMSEDCDDTDTSVYLNASCDDGDDCTIDDKYDVDCNCTGVFQDADADGICDLQDETNGDCELGGSCDDGDSCTVLDKYDEDCNCLGLFQDTDEDGICNAEDCKPFNANVYPGNTETVYNGIDDDCDETTLDDDLDQDGFVMTDDCDDMNAAIYPGASCDDGDGCTINDVYGQDCNCDGTFQDSDGDGICDADDSTNGDCELGGICDDENPLTGDGVYDENCNCLEGEILDCLGVAGGDTLPGVACDDGNMCTINDVYTEDCFCLGESLPIFTYYEDLDQDGFGNPDSTAEHCVEPAPIGFSDNDLDCDDNNADINPDAEDIPNNGIDEDCDGEDFLSSTLELNGEQIEIYPNPVSDLLQVNASIGSSLDLEFYDLSGRLIIQSSDTNTIDCSNLKEGMYLLNVMDRQSGDFVVERVVVSH